MSDTTQEIKNTELVNSSEVTKVITDADLCHVLQITTATLRNYLKSGPPTKRHGSQGDLRTISKCHVGGQRRWVLASVEAFIHGQQEID